MVFRVRGVLVREGFAKVMEPEVGSYNKGIRDL
jgi:hypothetical protein